MNGLGRRIVLGGVLALLATGFAWLNGTEIVRVNLGLVRINGISLPAVVFVAFLLGMLTLFLASLKSEMRTRRMLRRYREALGAEAFNDPERPVDEG